MRVDLFDFDLPPTCVALRPARPRDSARMLVVPQEGAFEDKTVRDLPFNLREGDALVVNDSRVIHARLSGRRIRGAYSAGVEATLIERIDHAQWRALMKPAKKLAVGDLIRFVRRRETASAEKDSFHARVEGKGDDGEVLLSFDLLGAELDRAIEMAGDVPLPPYIASRRAADACDESDYQTVFAGEAGAVAAPTAGLHFTPELIAAIESRGVRVFNVTLHVGAGTFLPVKAEDTDAHRMQEEFARLDSNTAAALNDAHGRGGRIIAVGTTALRTLESAAGPDGRLEAYARHTDIFITPGYRFRATDMLLTNFHLPRSTLFMLVSAFSGLDRMKAAYAHAIQSGYRFYSYGDACLLTRAEP